MDWWLFAPFAACAPSAVVAWVAPRFAPATWRTGPPGEVGALANERLAPDAVLTASNIPNTLANHTVDPDTDSTTFGNATDDGTDVTLALSFPTPTANLTTGAGLQNFHVRLRKSATGGNDGSYSIYLRESGTRLNAGSAIASGTIPTSITTGSVINATWDASLLGTISGVNVEIEVALSRSGGPPANRRVGDVGGVEWNADYTAAAAVGYARVTFAEFEVPEAPAAAGGAALPRRPAGTHLGALLQL